MVFRSQVSLPTTEVRLPSLSKYLLCQLQIYCLPGTSPVLCLVLYYYIWMGNISPLHVGLALGFIKKEHGGTARL